MKKPAKQLSVYLQQKVTESPDIFIKLSIIQMNVSGLTEKQMEGMGYFQAHQEPGWSTVLQTSQALVDFKPVAC